MPVYEFYCPDCHRIFNFMSRRMNTTKRPNCPQCNRPKIERRVSLFAVSKGLKEDAEEPPMPDFDESRMEQAMTAMADEVDKIDEEDPRQIARLMRKLYNATGLELGSGMEEAMQRMEAGEDPDKIEEELGDILDSEDPLAGMVKKGGLRGLRNKMLPPSVDEKLYDL